MKAPPNPPSSKDQSGQGVLLKEPFDISDSVASRPRDVSAGRVRGPAAAGPRHGHRHRQVHHPRVLDLGTKLVNA